MSGRLSAHDQVFVWLLLQRFYLQHFESSVFIKSAIILLA